MKNLKFLISMITVFAIALTFSACKGPSDTGALPTEAESGGEISVSMSIECFDILDNYSSLDEALQNEEYVPNNGIILSLDDVSIHDGDTVFDVLKKVTYENDIQFEYEESLYGVYIKGLNYIYEDSCGTLGGWLYTVNGEEPQVGCDSFVLKDSDEVTWYYVCDFAAMYEDAS